MGVVVRRLYTCSTDVLSHVRIHSACLDKRPFDSAGQTYQSGILRSASYCAHCKRFSPPVSSIVRSASEPSQKTCGHNYCILSLSTCCACTDRRPGTASYSLALTWGGTYWSMYCSSCRHFHDHPPLPQVTGSAREITVKTRGPVKSEKAESAMLEAREFKIDESRGTNLDKGGELEAEILVTKHRKECKLAVLLIFSHCPCCSDAAH
jgi:hypothetical protein